VSDSTDLSRLEFILEMIEDIEYIIVRYKSISAAIEDRIGKHALLMCLMQIGESLNKIESPALKDKLPVKGAYDVRNFIAHDYEGVDVGLIENILRYLIPELKETIFELKG